MCALYAQWHVVEKASHVTIEDEDGCFVGTMKNAVVASSVVNEHNKGLAVNQPYVTADGWTSKTIRKGGDESRATRSE